MANDYPELGISQKKFIQCCNPIRLVIVLDLSEDRLERLCKRMPSGLA
jgi:hypothetical protein